MGVSKWDAIMYCENRNLGQGVKITSKVSSRKKHPDSRHQRWAIQLPMDIQKESFFWRERSWKITQNLVSK